MLSDLLNRAMKAHQSGLVVEAAALYRQILAKMPNHADALNLLGVATCQSGQLESGRDFIVKAIALHRSPRYLLNYAIALDKLGQTDGAITACRDALHLDADYAEAHFFLGELLRRKRQWREALAAYRAGTAKNPAAAEVFVQIGGLCEEIDRYDEAIAAYRVALDLDPLSGEVHYRLGTLLHDLGREQDAIASFRIALEAQPGAFEIRWRLCMGRLRLVYDAVQEIETARAAYEHDLRMLAADCAAKSSEELARYSEIVGLSQPFYLPYQGGNDCELQAIYGGMVARIMQARYPQFAQRPPMPPLAAGGRIRIGFVSAYFCRHSNWKIPLRGWVQNLDPRRFELFGYHVGKRRDDETEVADKCFSKFIAEPISVEQWTSAIRTDALHILIFPETGMDPMTLKLAALHIAPIQAVSWGHPNTSGLPTIDYFLSSDLMENDEADRYYSERLVKLPNLGIHYTPPVVPRMELPRDKIGLRPSAIVYWCCQTLFKYLPQHDDVFPRIARQVEKCQFVFIRHASEGRVSETFQDRLMKAFARHGLSAKDHCVFLPKMDLARFNAMARNSDVFLDSIEWSACNSLLENLMFDLPAVVMAGQFMRGRHGAAIMAMMKLDNLVAKTVDEYVALAVRLGNDARLRQTIRAEIHERKHLLIKDRAAIEGLEVFFASVVEDAQARRAEA